MRSKTRVKGFEVINPSINRACYELNKCNAILSKHNIKLETLISKKISPAEYNNILKELQTPLNNIIYIGNNLKDILDSELLETHKTI